jgi:hypothetical protein
MKKILVFLLATLGSYFSYSQYVYTASADSVKFTNDSHNTELIVENNTRDICGFLFNKGNGRTEFRKILIPVGTNKFLIGCDTLDLSGIGSISGSLQLLTDIDSVTTHDIKVGNGMTVGRGHGSFPSNTTFGLHALDNTSSSGLGNTAIGYYSMQLNTSGGSNTASGYGSLQNNTTGSFNSAFGTNSMVTNTTGSQNAGIGYGSLEFNTTGNYNSANGYRALRYNTTASFNTAIGNTAMAGSTSGITGSANTAIGYGALNGLSTAFNNVAIGYASMNNASTTGSLNVGIGTYSLRNNIAGIGNVAIGDSAGYTTNGNRNVFIGKNAGKADTGSNKLYIDNSSSATPLIGGDFLSRIIKLNGTTNISDSLSVGKIDSIAAPSTDMLSWNSLTKKLQRSVPPGNNGSIAISNQTANYTLQLTDIGKMITQTVSAANKVTVPPDSSVAFPIGTKIMVNQYGLGQVSIANGIGVVINSPDGALRLRVQYGMGTLIKIAANTWILNGDISNTVTTYDVDAKKFFDSSGITDSTQKLAINNFVTQLKDSSLWTKFVAIYPMVGGTAGTTKWNLKDPRNSDAAYRLTFTGSPTYATTGVLFPTISDYANSHLSDSLLGASNNNSIAYYSRTQNTISGYDIGCTDNGSPANEIAIYHSYDATNWFGYLKQNPMPAITKGLFLFSATSGDVKRYENGAIVNAKGSAPTTTFTNLPILIGKVAFASAGGQKECALAAMGQGLTDAQALTFYRIVQNFQNTLGR